MRAIFISYRREDAEGQAGRLFDDLDRHFGDDSVFMDVAGLELGRDFRRTIDEQVASCGVLLALIGKNWLDAKTESGQRRLEDPMDFVRLETASALKRDIPVIPVLVGGAQMPRVEDLPEDLKELAFRNGIELTHVRWDSDVQVLVKALTPYVHAMREPTERPTSSEPIKRNPTRTVSPRVIAVGVSVLVLALALAGYLWDQSSSQEAVGKAQDWAGNWLLTFEFPEGTTNKPLTMRLISNRYGIKGDYGLGPISGTFVDPSFSTVTGEFTNTTGTGTDCKSGAQAGQQGGSFSLTLSEDGKSMDGWWKVCGEGYDYLWKARKIEDISHQ